MSNIPRWADLFLIPMLNLVIAFVLSGLVIVAIGKDPFVAIKTMFFGAFGDTRSWGYTLYYTTNFIFTGLAVAFAFKAKLFNIGGEGQATLGGLGVALVCLYFDWPHWSVALFAAVLSGGLFGAMWAAIPAYLQVKRGSNIVITTIMFNFIAASLLGYLLVYKLKAPKSMVAETSVFSDTVHLPTFYEMLAPLGISFGQHAPANISFFIAIFCCFIFWVVMRHTRLGYMIRAYGHSENAAIYAGISPFKITMITMLLSGSLAGLMAVNSVMGEAERLVLNSVEGAGFIGIAVALMGRAHPLGVFLAALLFGFLYQGGAELALWESIPRELIIVIQALVILFTGALDNLVKYPVEKVFAFYRRIRG